MSNFVFFFFNDTATTEIYTLSLHDALPISTHEGDGELTRVLLLPAPYLGQEGRAGAAARVGEEQNDRLAGGAQGVEGRSEEHTSELQSRQYLVCRLLLEKKLPQLAPKRLLS